MKPNVLLYFVRYPEPGKVKTRLAKSIGFEKAAEVYKRLAEETFFRIKTSKDWSVVVTFDPPTQRSQIEGWLTGAAGYLPQKGVGLGERLNLAFNWAFEDHTKKVLAVGSDTLDLNLPQIQSAFRALDHSEVALGPSRDGGYYLIGLKKPQPEIFKGINWSTEQVRAQTIEKIETLRLSFQQIQMLEDLDEITQI